MKQKSNKNKANETKTHESKMFAKITDKESIKKILNRFVNIGIDLTQPIKFKKKPYYQHRYSNYMKGAYGTLTFFIPKKVLQECRAITKKDITPGDRWLLKVNDKYLLIEKISKHSTGFSFILGENEAKKLKIKKCSTSTFQLLKIAKYNEIKKKIIKEYLKGTDIKTLEANYPLSYAFIHKIFKSENIQLRSISEQEAIRFHGRLPNVKDGLSYNKLALIFGIFGDNVGNVNGKGFAIGIHAGRDLDFAQAFSKKFEKEYDIRPYIRESDGKFRVEINNKNIFYDLRRYAIFGSHSWKLVDNAWKIVRRMNKAKLGKCISFFWEAEGCPIPKSKTIEATSVNLLGLKQIQKIMDKLKIKTTITGPNFVASPVGLYTIRISGRKNIELFKKLVNFISSRKKEGIKKLLKSYKRNNLIF
jgi:hypothetical protein